MTTMTARDLRGLRERREFERAEQQKQLDTEDRIEYGKYVTTIQDDNRKVAPAFHIQPLPFDEWRKLMPEGESDPSVRAAIATSKALWSRLANNTAQRAATQPFDDDELRELGFDLSERVSNPEIQLSVFAIRAGFEQFALSESGKLFDKDLHFRPVADFLTRNRLYPSGPNVCRAFQLLLNMNVITRMPEPEPRNPQLNSHGVNLTVEVDPAFEEKKRRDEYRSRVVVTDPRDGSQYTQFQLDHIVDAETYRRLVLGENAVPKISDVIKPKW